VCLAIPGKIIELDQKKQSATVDYGSGTTRKANVSLVQVKIGDYILVHAGFAIQILDKKEAQETLTLFKEMLSLQEEG
jgi:hydrogenase expression/formation protein HypC